MFEDALTPCTGIMAQKALLLTRDRADGSVTERLTRKGRHGECVRTLGRGAAAAGRGGRRTRSEKKAQLVERWCPNTGAFKLLESCDFLLLPVWAVDQ